MKDRAAIPPLGVFSGPLPGPFSGPFSLEMPPRVVASSPAPPPGLPMGSEVYIPALPGAPFAATAAAAERLLAWGMRPVPHLAARAIPDARALDERLRRLADLGVDRLMLVGGDLRQPLGPYPDVLSLLRSGLPLRHGFTRFGLAGHPEGHPAVPDAVLYAALAAKREFLAQAGCRAWLVTQFAFAPEPVAAWLEEPHIRGIGLPVRVGIPGPAPLRTLLRYALQCGVAASAAALRRRPLLLRLAGRWSPDALLDGLAAHCARMPETPLAGLHLFPFGGVERGLAWLQARQQAACPAAAAQGRLSVRGGRR